MPNDPPQIHYLAVLVAALSSFLIGGLWYSPLLFGNVWARENALSDEELKRGSPVKIFGGAFLLSLIMAANLAAFIGPDASWSFGTFAGFAAGLGWVAAALGILYLFERRSLKHFLINASYVVVAMTAMGTVLAAWPGE